MKTRRIEYFKNKTGFYDFKTFEGMVEYGKKTAMGEGLDKNLLLNRGKFMNGVLEGLCLR